MMHQEIFQGLDLTEEIARDLAIYHRAAGGMIGVIDAKGHLTTKKKTWLRPMAHKHFKDLKEALQSAKLAIVCNDYIVVDFPALTYNLEWVRELIKSDELGVQDSPEGLCVFQKKESDNTPLWYTKAYWPLRGVTVKGLGLKLKEEVVSLSANPENPDYAAWAKLYFVA